MSQDAISDVTLFTNPNDCDIEVVEDKPLKLISPFTGYAGAISSAIGVGIFALSQAYQKGSVVVAMVLCAICYVLSICSSQMFLEAAARYWYKKRGNFVLPDDRYATTSMLCRDLPRHRAVGRVLSICFQICNFIYLFATLLETAFAATQTFASDIPLKDKNGHTYHCGDPAASDFSPKCNDVFWGLLIGLTCLLMFITFFDLRKVGWLFNIFIVWRWFVMFIVIGFCSYAIGHNGAAKDVAWTKTDIAGFAYLAPALVFAFIWQASIGVVYEPIRDKPKNLPIVFTALTITMTFLYALIGLLGVIAFGAASDAVLVNNFHSIKMGNNFVRFLAQCAILYPPFSYLSTCPLIAQPLATQVLEWFPERCRNKKGYIMSVRALCVWVPAIIAGFYRHFNIIVQISGIGSYLIMLLFPPIMLLLSNDLRDKTKCVYWRWWISLPFQILLIVAGVFFPIVTLCYM